MPKKQEKTEIRARCRSCNFKGKWQLDIKEAKKDGNDHLKSQSTHEMDLEFKASYLVSIKET